MPMLNNAISQYVRVHLGSLPPYDSIMTNEAHSHIQTGAGAPDPLKRPRKVFFQHLIVVHYPKKDGTKTKTFCQ